ncbi:ABC transporter ATP-binding protein [Paenibacillus sp. y28]|uniref:ABC transporter ATP-binding protein n=1 Tax=Paenibacillus sp. y28 TaxID=3129110 RepID=UPI00301AF2A2
MFEDVVIKVDDVSKCFHIYKNPQDRLKQTIFRGYKQFYHEYWALRNVFLEVKKGESVGIVGRNGSGKSTLLQIIAGTLNSTSGTVTVNGRIAALLELGSGFNPEFTGKENVYLNGAILGLSKKEIDNLYDEIADFADIGDFINQPVKTYSSGMEVRLAFAVQAVVPKEILIVDEALAVGDELFQRKCFAKIDEFKKNGGTILFVSHSGGTVIELCDRAMLLDTGEEIITDSSKKVVNLYQKLLYAPNEKKAAIKNEIRLSKKTNANQILKDSSPGTILSNEPKKDLKLEEMYDPYLIPKETIEYETEGVEISNPRILTMDGKLVNHLISGKKYRWCYDVTFKEACKNVKFGMLIKTASGFDLGGAVSSNLDDIAEIDNGEIVKVEFIFRPRLGPGTYFLNAGVIGKNNNNEETYIARKIDLAAFKIMHDTKSTMTAVVDFEIVPEVVRIEGTEV